MMLKISDPEGSDYYFQGGRRNRVIMVTSVFPGEGKTFVAANLAVTIAQGIMNLY
jgi:Mrp family chromosome partitioning ATPase